MSTTKTPDQINPDDYLAIFYAGGHGAMFDFPENKQLAEIASKIYEKGGIVAAVCHGPAGLINITLQDETNLIKGKKFDCFTNAEEDANGTAKYMPFLLQTALEEKGGLFDGAKPWSDHVVKDGRLITGQNPQSALDLGKQLLSSLS